MQMHETCMGNCKCYRAKSALPCADVATRVMSSDLLNWNLLINLLDNWKSSLDATVYWPKPAKKSMFCLNDKSDI